MEQQRLYFEEKLRKIEKEKNMKIATLEEEYAQLLEDRTSFEKRLSEMEYQMKQSSKKNPETQKKIKELEKENKLLTEINDTLKKAQQKWQEKALSLEKKISEDNSKEKKIRELEVRIKMNFLLFLN